MEHLHTFSMRLVMKYLDRILQYSFRIRPVIDFANVSSLYFSPSTIRACVPSSILLLLRLLFHPAVSRPAVFRQAVCRPALFVLFICRPVLFLVCLACPMLVVHWRVGPCVVSSLSGPLFIPWLLPVWSGSILVANLL